MLKKLIIIIMFFINTNIVLGDENKKNQNQLLLKYNLKLIKTNLMVDADDKSSDTINYVKYETDVNSVHGIDISYKNVGFSYNVSQDYINTGQSPKYTDFQVYLDEDSFGMDFIYQRYKGFHVDYSVYSENPNRSDIYFKNISMNLYLKASLDFGQDKLEKKENNYHKSKAYLFLGISPSYIEFSAYDSLTPNGYYNYGAETGLTSGRFFGVKI